jgi:hypothetical protein
MLMSTESDAGQISTIAHLYGSVCPDDVNVLGIQHDVADVPKNLSRTLSLIGKLIYMCISLSIIHAHAGELSS